MGSKGGNIIEKHIDKLLLAAIGLVCLFMLFRVFIAPPYKVQVEGKNVGPGSIDKQVEKNAERLELEINQPAKNVKGNYPENKQTDKFLSFMEEGIRDFNNAALVIDTDIYAIVPAGSDDGSSVAARKYEMPLIAVISKAQAGLFRCVAYVPQQEVTMDYPYGSVPDEQEDLDMVTVQATLDFEALADSFYGCFAGRTVKRDWQDEELAKPVFAAVSLERQELDSDGNWSDWQKTGFTKINNYKELLDLPDNLDELKTTGIRTLIARLNTPEIRNQIIQPSAYDFVYPAYGWIAPEFETERQKQIKKEKDLARRRDSETRKPTRTRDTGKRDARSRRTRQPAGGGEMGGMGGGMGGMGMPGGGGGAAPAARTPRRRERKPERERQPRPERERKQSEKEIPDPEELFADIALEQDTDILEFSTITFWAHDDTAKPGGKYKYRIRLGIANPIAGIDTAEWKNSNEQDSGKFIFWSDYVEASEIIEIPERMYLFATDVKRAADKTVSVEVAKYELGNWQKEEFIVRPGETIGSVVEVKDEIFSRTTRREDKEKTEVDYSTGAVMVDIVEQTLWTGRSILASRSYYNLLYSIGNGNVATMPAKKTFWAKQTTRIYNEIEEAVKNPVSLSGTGRRGRGGREAAPTEMPGGGMMGPGMMGPGMMEMGF